MLFYNYIKLAWRNLSKRKLYSVINIGGLAAGLCVCMLIMLYVAHELSYDRFHKDAPRIFSLLERIKMQNDTIQFDRFNYANGPAIQQQNAAVKSYMRIGSLLGETAIMQNVSHPAIKDAEPEAYFVDANYFSFFSFPLLEGDPAEVLRQPFMMVISSSMATKYFGKEDAVGKQIRYNGKYTFQVSGVMADAPSNSSIQADFLMSGASIPGIESLRQFTTDPHGFGGPFKLYIKLDDAANRENVTKNINLQIAQDKDPGLISLVPLAKIHLGANFQAGFNLRYLKLFPMVAILILLMALINYMSLSTARATIRAREIGIRKALGADHKRIAQQFYVESALYALLAFCLAVVLCITLRPWFFNLLQLKVDNGFLYNPMVIFIYVALLLVTIIVAGSYPSFILSRYKPVAVLAGKMSPVSGGASVRKVLTVLQFGTAAVLIICSIVINRQLYFFRHTATGINKENVLMVPFASTLGTHYQAFRQQVASLNGVLQTGTAHHPLFNGMDMWFVSEEADRPAMTLYSLNVDRQLMEIAGLQWKIPPQDMSQLGMGGKIVLNEIAVEKYNLSPTPIGKHLQLGNKDMEVIGVLKNFHFVSLHSPIAPLGLTVEKDNSPVWGTNTAGCLFVKIAPGQNIPSLIEQIRKTYTNYDAQTPFKYSFLDDAFGKMYTAEDRLANIFGGFTALTVLIAGLGLLGLAAFSAEQRTREIGVRKILGASVIQITALLSKDFMRLVVVALVIASPLAWYLMQQWLQQFAYRIHMQPWMFVLTAIMAITAALLAIGLQTIRAATRNPVTTLRVE
ncbi:putative ABC transport system permease protein [Chitinophaga niastensis]|uniref:Putative ABC transport system permease protein n=1 Tax=Chitinophaga niastensis TaxID=536980 RepID=A0A2P8HS92_CHINA|nr:ABC transporter permease [Chitinophaga niastensis]PSL49068.1 putative ABC transport system permease protein [Chitinophaga niastensis]